MLIKIIELCLVDYISEEDTQNTCNDELKAIRTVIYESDKDVLSEAFKDYQYNFDSSNIIDCIDSFSGTCLETLKYLSIKEVKNLKGDNNMIKLNNVNVNIEGKTLRIEGLTMTQEMIDFVVQQGLKDGMSRTRLKNRLIKLDAEHRSFIEQKRVTSLQIAIKWKKSATWGYNPHGTVTVVYADGTQARFDGFTASGCGYDKESTVIAEIFNSYLRYRLYELDLSNSPYGIRSWVLGNYYEGGVGTSCYYNIAKFIGGQMTQIYSDKDTTVYSVELENKGGM